MVPIVYFLPPPAGTPCHSLRKTELDTSEGRVTADRKILQTGGCPPPEEAEVYSPSPISSFSSLEMTADFLSKA